MKWLFFLLVLLNVVAVGWYGFRGDEVVESADPVYAPPVSQRILALSEVRETTAQKPDEAEISFVNELEAELRALAEAEAKAEEVKVHKAVQAKVAEQLICPVMSFEKDQEKSQVLARVQGVGWKVKEYRSHGDRQRFWVYIDAPASRQDAIRAVDRLKQQGVDSFIINRGEMKGRISLGLYSSAEAANTEKNRITNLSDFVVKVFEHMRSVPLSVLEIEEGISESDWSSFASSLELGNMMIKLEKNPC